MKTTPNFPKLVKLQPKSFMFLFPTPLESAQFEFQRSNKNIQDTTQRKPKSK